MVGVELAKIGGIFLLSTVKLFFAPGAGIAAGLGFWTTFFTTAAGGCTGVSFFFFAGNWVMRQFDKRKNTTSPKKESDAKSRYKVFNRKNRFIVAVKQRYGLIGLALLTPGVISIPIGTVVAARFYAQDKLAFPLLLISTILWAFGLSLFSHFFNNQILHH